MAENGASRCPVAGANTSVGAASNQGWWPNQLNLRILHQDNPPPIPWAKFDYAAEFETLDFEALARDVDALMTQSQDWWPADYGHYGPLFIRMTWHGAGTYRIADGRGGGGSGAQRFAPLNSWPDNANLDKARRLLWPIKQKYGRKISWADLIIFAGNCALEIDGPQDVRLRRRSRGHLGARGGRLLGPGDHVARRRALQRRSRARESARRGADGPDLRQPGGAERQPRPARGRARHPRDVRPHGDERRGDGRAHRRRSHVRQDARRSRPNQNVGPQPEGASLEEQGFGWRNSFGSGKGVDTITQRARGRVDHEPHPVGQRLLREPVRIRVGEDEEPRGRGPVDPEERGGAGHRARRARQDAEARADDADDGPRAHRGPRLQGDLEALPRAPGRAGRCLREGLVQAAHRDMGPVSRYLGPWVPKESLLWQDPVPAVTHALVEGADVAALAGKVLASGLSDLAAGSTAWASASTFRGTDKRGGANGARIRLSPQEGWDVNVASGSRRCSRSSRACGQEFNDAQKGGKQISLADLIVLGGGAAVEQAAKQAGHDVKVPFTPGRTDATQEQTDVDVVRRARADRRRLPQLRRRRASRPRPSTCWWNGPC